MGSSQSQQRPGTSSSWFSSTPQGSGIYGSSNNYVQPSSSSWLGLGGRKRKSKVNKKTNHKTKRKRR